METGGGIRSVRPRDFPKRRQAEASIGVRRYRCRRCRSRRHRAKSVWSFTSASLSLPSPNSPRPWRDQFRTPAGRAAARAAADVVKAGLAGKIAAAAVAAAAPRRTADLRRPDRRRRGRCRRGDPSSSGCRRGEASRRPRRRQRPPRCRETSRRGGSAAAAPSCGACARAAQPGRILPLRAGAPGRALGAAGRTDGTEPGLGSSRRPNKASRILSRKPPCRCGSWPTQARFELADAGVGAFERLVLDQHRLHQRIGCVRGLTQAIVIRRSASGSRCASSSVARRSNSSATSLRSSGVIGLILLRL